MVDTFPQKMYFHITLLNPTSSVGCDWLGNTRRMTAAYFRPCLNVANSPDNAPLKLSQPTNMDRSYWYELNFLIRCLDQFLFFDNFFADNRHIRFVEVIKVIIH
jgi:hypothetical protein